MKIDILAFNAIGEQIKHKISLDCGLNLSQTRLLLFFYNTNNDSLTMGELAKALNISLSTLSRQINQKKTLDFVNITRSKTDSSKLLNLNQKGLQKAEELTHKLKHIQDELFSPWNQEQIKNFESELKQISKSLYKY